MDDQQHVFGVPHDVFVMLAGQLCNVHRGHDDVTIGFDDSVHKASLGTVSSTT